MSLVKEGRNTAKKEKCTKCANSKRKKNQTTRI